MAGDCAARRRGQVAATNDVWNTSVLDLLFGRARARNLRHSVHCRAANLVDRDSEQEAARLGRGSAPLLHCRGGKPGTDHVASGVDASHRRTVGPIDTDPSPSINLHTGLFKSKAVSVRGAPGGEQHRVRDQHGAAGERDPELFANPVHRIHADTQLEFDPTTHELLRHEGCHFGVDAWQQALGLAYQGFPECQVR
jgi:hypothetical protein